MTLEKVFKETKIPREFLTALEGNRYHQLPEGLYPHLYVREYARFLDLSEEKMVAFFRRDYQTKEGRKKPFLLNKFDFSSKWEKVIGFGLIVFIFLSYLIYQYLNFALPPKIKIRLLDSPQEGRILKGKTDPEATLKIEGKIVNLDEKGNFSYPVDPDKKELTIVAESPTGKKREIVEKL